MSNKACLITHKKIKTQWIKASLYGLSAYDDGNVAVLTGKQVLPAFEEHVSFSAVTSAGMSKHSLNLVLVASLPVMPQQGDGLYAFLLQATAVMVPLEFIVDLKTGYLIIRHSFITSSKSTVPAKAFIDTVNWFAPRISKAVTQIEQQGLSVKDARLMADYLLEDYCEALAV